MKNILPLSLFISTIVTYAQTKYQEAEGFKYLDVVNINASKGADLPLIVAFHYSSSTPEETVGEYDSIKIPVRLIIPRGNFRKRNGFSYFPTDYYSKDSLTQMAIAKETVDSIADFLKNIIVKYKRKPIVAGFSQGGDISFLLGIYYPELIRGAFPLAGFVHQQRLEDIINHGHKIIPIHVFQGEDDKIVLADYSREEVSLLAPSFNISLTTYPALGHDFSNEMKRDYSAAMTKVLEQ